MGNSYVYVGPIGTSFGNNPNMSQAATYTAGRINGELNATPNNESSLMSELMGGGAFMAAIEGRHTLMNPIKSISALKNANTSFKELHGVDTFKKLSNSQKHEVFSTLYKNELLSNKALKEGLRSTKQTKKLKAAITTATNNYKEALKAGDTIKAAKFKAEIETLIKSGKKQGWIGRAFNYIQGKSAPKVLNLKEVKNAAKAAGEAAETAAQTAKATAEAAKATASTTKAGQALTWTKGALKTGGFGFMAAIEGLIEGVTEVLPAFGESTGEGVKQTAKSAASVAASATGWCVGFKAGATAGAAIGTAICPGVGTAIGGAVGSIVGGITTSWAGRKIAKFFTGKSYSEKQAEKEQKTAQQQQQPVTNTQTQSSINPFTSPEYNPYNIDFNNIDYNNYNYDMPKSQYYYG